MPYIPGGTVQAKSSRPDVADVYSSTDVFINNVRAALWLAPGTSESFAGNVSVAPVIVPTIENQAVLDSFISNPENFAIDTDDQVKLFFPGTPDQSTQADAQISAAVAEDIVPFLAQLLEEANRGVWEETGMGGRPSNPNIINLWKELGYPQSGPWLTDQTPWCMGFVNFVLKRTGYRYIQTARAFDIRDRTAAYGATQIPLNQGQPGDIAVWSYSHVNFVYTATGGRYTFVGGNQSTRARNNNNPSSGTITNSWPGGYAPPGNASLRALYRPTKTPPPPPPEPPEE